MPSSPPSTSQFLLGIPGLPAIRLWAVLLVALGVAALLPAFAQGHASLIGTEPERGATLESSPGEIVFSFDEGVEANLGGVRVFNAAGEQVEIGSIERPNNDDKAIAVSLPTDLPDDIYTATFRILSADGHPISGGFLFTVGEAAGGPNLTVSELLADSESGQVTTVAFWLVRWVSYLAIGIGIGAVAFMLLVWGPALRRSARQERQWITAGLAMRRALRRLLIGAAIAGLITALLSIGLQAAAATGDSFFAVLKPGTIGDVLGTRYGEMALVRAVAWVLLAGLMLGPGRKAIAVLDEGDDQQTVTATPPLTSAALVVLGLIIAATPMLSGHATNYSPAWLLAPADLLHVLAMSAWLAGLVSLAIALPRATRHLSPEERPSLLAANLEKFSPLALTCVIVLIATGTAESIVYLDSPANLFDSAFGRAISLKVVLIGALVAIGAFNRRRLMPGLREVVARRETAARAGIVIRRSLRAEVGLIVTVLAVTAALVSYSPPGSVPDGPAAGSVVAGELRLEYTVDPATIGANEVHLYIFDAADGAQYDDARSVTASATLPEKDLGPVEIDLQVAGPGHYTAPAAPFGIAGEWNVEVDVRTGEFDQTTLGFGVPIR